MRYLVVLILVLTGCGPDWDPGFFCKGSAGASVLPEYPESVQPQTQSIVNGTLSTDRRATVHVSTGCSGVAMDPYVVLTAAHCVGDGPMTVGTSPDAYRIEVDDRYVHRAYNGQAYPEWDLAVLHLAEPIEGPFPSGIYDPAEGGYEPDIRYYCTHLLAQGYGRTGDNPPGLYELEFEVGEVRWHTLVTAASENADIAGICYGDSGSPLYAYAHDRNIPGKINMWVAGIAVQGLDLGNGCRGQSLHMFLENFSPWLREVRRCMRGGEDRLWDFYTGGVRGSTCEDLRK